MSMQSIAWQLMSEEDYGAYVEEKMDKQIAISDLADKFLNEALAKGEPFTEGLTNWAISKAEQELGT